MKTYLLCLMVCVIGLLAPDLISAPAVAAADAQIRVIHASPDTPAVDVYLDATKVVPALSFGDASEYLQVAVGTHNIRLFAVGANPSVDRPFIAAPNTQISAGMKLSIVAAGMFTSIRGVTVNDNAPLPLSSRAKVRFVNVGADAPAVDLAISGMVVFSNTPFGMASPYQDVDVGPLTLDVRPAGESKRLITTTVRPEAGSNSSVYLMSLGVIKTFVDTDGATSTANTNAASNANTMAPATALGTSTPGVPAMVASSATPVMLGATGRHAASRDTLSTAVVLASLVAIGSGFALRRRGRQRNTIVA